MATKLPKKPMSNRDADYYRTRKNIRSFTAPLGLENPKLVYKYGGKKRRKKTV